MRMSGVGESASLQKTSSVAYASYEALGSISSIWSERGLRCYETSRYETSRRQCHWDIGLWQFGAKEGYAVMRQVVGNVIVSSTNV